MSHAKTRQLVFTIKDRCRVCYTCLRECPVKAIKIINGQAEVLHERCIGCGNCVKVCSQDAKYYLETYREVYAMLKSGEKVVACIAPSFPAEFVEIEDYRVFVGMVRRLGFSHVAEIGFAADMVGREYRKLRDNKSARRSISSDCPAVVFFVEHYHPELVPYLAPITSPMVAMSRIIRHQFGKDVKVVFIGPCISKKAESDEVDDVITFRELRKMFEISKISPKQAEPSDFDPPTAYKGAIFPLSRGLLQTTDITEDLCEGRIIVAEGRVNFREAIKEFENGFIDSQHLELLCCEGCIMGPGMSPNGQKYVRSTKISNYVRRKLKSMDTRRWQEAVDTFSEVDLSQEYTLLDRRINLPSPESVEKVLLSMGKTSVKDHLNCGACGYDTCEQHAIAILQGLAEVEMCLPFTIEKLHNSVKDLNISNEKLARARQALKQSERLASMGQLSAGIAHELNNPLGVITMYSNILMDEAPPDAPVRKDLELIVEQADRCKKIVGGLLNFARKNQVNLSEVDIIKFTQQSISNIVLPGNIRVVFNPSVKNTKAMLDTDQMMQVLTNIEKNAIEAMPKGGELRIDIQENREEIIFRIGDTGCGISKENMDKIFTPFFTTKGIGKGTGLGLPIIYGIVKMHRGKVTVSSNANPAEGPMGTCFEIKIPRNGNS